jgi:hypothetical protein
MVWLVIGVLSLIPLGTYAACRRLAHASRMVAVLAAGVSGSALGGFLASAGSAMATAVEPGFALAKGGAVGFVGGAAVGILGLVMELAWSGALGPRRRRTPG